MRNKTLRRIGLVTIVAGALGYWISQKEWPHRESLYVDDVPGICHKVTHKREITIYHICGGNQVKAFSEYGSLDFSDTVGKSISYIGMPLDEAVRIIDSCSQGFEEEQAKTH